MIEPRCLIGACDSRDSFPADFAAQGNGFVGTRRFKAPPAAQRWRAHAMPGLTRA
jgi:hypothetical protein